MRLWQRLFLALAGISSLILLGYVWHQQVVFRDGFLKYLDASALERIRPAAAVLASEYQRAGGSWDPLRNNPRRLPMLVDSVAGRFMARGRPPDWASPDDARTPAATATAEPAAPRKEDDREASDPHSLPAGGAPRWPQPSLDGRQPPSGSGGPRDAFDLLGRLALRDAQGRHVAGNAQVEAGAAGVPIELDGVVIGQLRMAPMPQLDSLIQREFASRQQRSAISFALLAWLLALLCAWVIARKLSAPLRAIAEGSRALAAGAYEMRLPSGGRDEFAALARDFNHLAHALEEHRSARRSAGADLAHELRTPLTILRGEVQLLQDGVRPFGRPALDSLESEIDRLAAVVEDLYELALADAGALEYRFARFDLAALVLEAVELSRPQLQAAHLELRVELPAQLHIDGDWQRLRRLVDNLLVNARRYTDAPGVLQVRLELDTSAALARLEVEDSPPGVPAELLPRLFERLFRVEKSRSRAVGGAGLGLSICRSIVAAHGGRIDANASALGGLRIVVELPLERPA